ncbi:MAG: ZIP family metal transporter [Planctomycetes bacterium]|jgi:zinc and cadmium transporter|nr:ZIP family metal transporter [Planctomycetota bacterium]
MAIFFWIGGAILAMSLISLVGVVTFILKEKALKKLIFPLVAFSAGALLGGAMLHMLPEAIEAVGIELKVFLWLLFGFTVFFLLEQFIHWHHCHRLPSEHKHPVTYLILIADGLHNFIDGLAITSAFLVNVKLGIVTWLAAAAHEIPQELGDYGILIHGGWQKKQALFFNFLSALTMFLGAATALYLATKINIAFLLAFAAGNFIYIACSDLIPEIKHREHWLDNVLHFLAFSAGMVFILLIKFIE